MNPSIPEARTTAAPKIVVLGATGPTGRHIVGQALSRGFDVTALVRSPGKAGDLEGAELVVGDARDEKALRQAVEGRDAVISAIGTPASPFREVTLLSAATRALVGAMKAEQVSRLVAITGIGAGDSRGHGGFAFRREASTLTIGSAAGSKFGGRPSRSMAMLYALIRSLRPLRVPRQDI